MSSPSSRFETFFPFIGIFLFTIASIVLWHSVRHYSLTQIIGALYSIPHNMVLIALGTALFGYCMLSLYDWLGLRYAGETLPYPKILLASFLGYAISNNVGHPLFSGGAIRYRLYSSWGLSTASIARVILFCSASYVVGAITLLVASYVFFPSPLPINNYLSPSMVMWIIGLASTLLLIWWILIIFYHHVPLQIKNFKIFLPSPHLAWRQTLVAILDVVLASLVLYIPFHAVIPMEFLPFLTLYIMAQLMAMLSQVPGGLGVFEGSFMFLTQGFYNPSQILAALIICRISYYFIPLLIAGITLIIYEIRRTTK